MTSLSDNLLMLAKQNRRSPPATFEFDYVTASDGARLRYGTVPADPSAKGTVLFLPGRTEFIEKFYEDMHIFTALGYSVAGMDLRGQGLSHRENPDRDKHDLASFDVHIGDVDAVITHLMDCDMPQPFYIMAHSAGSHVTLRYLHDHGDRIQAAITVAPMVRIAGSGAPQWMMKSLADLMCRLGKADSYVPGHQAFKDGRWGWRRKLTHDDDRFLDEDYFIFEKDRALAVGGATFRWLLAAITSTDILNAPGYAEAIDTPVLMVQADQDQIVDNRSMSAFAARAPGVKLEIITNAMHEIMKETDDARRQLWQHISTFLDLDSSL